LSITHVEDSVNPRFVDEYGPKTEVAVQQSRHACTQLTLASALGGGPLFARVANEAALGLALLDEVWHDTQGYRRKHSEGLASGRSRDSKLMTFYERRFDESFEQLQVVRRRLSGFDGNDSLEEELAQGGVLPGSLLFQLRELTSAPKLN
jgi:hypothetical protein